MMILEGNWIAVIAPVGDIVRVLPNASPFDLNIVESGTEPGSNPVRLACRKYNYAVGAAGFKSCFDVRHIVLLVAISIYGACSDLISAGDRYIPSNNGTQK